MIGSSASRCGTETVPYGNCGSDDNYDILFSMDMWGLGVYGRRGKVRLAICLYTLGLPVF